MGPGGNTPWALLVRGRGSRNPHFWLTKEDKSLSPWVAVQVVKNPAIGFFFQHRSNMKRFWLKESFSM